MKLTNQQALIMFQTVLETLKITGNDEMFTYKRSFREKIINEIFDQQGNDIIDLEGVEDKDAMFLL
ncbi:MAG: hypothetical protein SFH39_00065 [Candidatus Magnetobacterium sp. LHC-1]